jgi:hypothetical protein
MRMMKMISLEMAVLQSKFLRAGRHQKFSHLSHLPRHRKETSHQMMMISNKISNCPQTGNPLDFLLAKRSHGHPSVSRTILTDGERAEAWAQDMEERSGEMGARIEAPQPLL